uniref:Transposon Ty3-I Gag-Pol polyprotein n=1 Tax=Cajanus cajan TaxID=3821 RepID=A0A151T467_CAJCA|nr:Transposon Ty3-I Gag-Pol polyprotein [Cajanus cajan]
MAPELALLLQTYSSVFDTPTSLPPTRAHGHFIPLIQGSMPVKFKPYGYPHSQKEDIERLVEDMLTEGIIQPSKSHFSSPIILVKRKYGSWKVCTGYRALNAITIKDNFPIPTVDELIDELFGASFFSKLDLRSSYHQILLNPEDRFETTFRTQRFVKNYAMLATPLIDLLKKDAFKWTEDATLAFDKIKDAMISTPVLALPNFKEIFILETDASGTGIGAMLSQGLHPIAYFSKKLSLRMQKQSAYIREFYIIIESLAKFIHYLLGHKFIIRTDQKSLKEHLDQSL